MTQEFAALKKELGKCIENFERNKELLKQIRNPEHQIWVRNCVHSKMAKWLNG